MLRVARAGVLFALLRLPGFAWIWICSHLMGSGSYAMFAVASAASTLLVSLLDGASVPAAVVASEPQLAGQRFWRRAMFGMLSIATLLLAALHLSPVLALAAGVAAGELLMNELRLRWRRQGQPDREQGLEVLRQVVSVALPLASLQFGLQSTQAMLTYVGGYAVALFFGPFRDPAPHKSERLPKRLQLSTATLLGAVYSQGDVLILGLIVTDQQLISDYAIGSLVALYASAGAQFATQVWAARLRAHAWRTPNAVAALAACSPGLALVGVVLTNELGITNLNFAMIAAPCAAAFFRSRSWWLSHRLLVRGFHYKRTAAALLAAAAKLVCISVLAAMFADTAILFTLPIGEVVLFLALALNCSGEKQLGGVDRRSGSREPWG